METEDLPGAVLRDPRKRRSWVIYRLHSQGRTLAEVAEAHGVTRQCLYHVFNAPYPHMEKLVAEAVGLRPEVLFAERYDADGQPARRKGRPRKISCHGKDHKRKDARSGKPWQARG